MRIGDIVIRVKEEHNLRKIGDIAVVDGLKVYNKGVSVHLEGDRPDTWNSESNYRNIEDVNMPCLEAKLAHVKETLRLGGERLKALKKDRKMTSEEISDDIIKESFDDNEMFDPEDELKVI